MKRVTVLALAANIMVVALAMPGFAVERIVQLELRSNDQVASSMWLVAGTGSPTNPYVLRPPMLVDAALPAAFIENVSAHVVIEGFSAKSPFPNLDRAGIFIIRNSSNVSIRDASFEGFQGISIEKSHDITVSRTFLVDVWRETSTDVLKEHYWANGINVASSHRVTISDVTVSGFTTGVAFAVGSTGVEIRDSSFDDQSHQGIAVLLDTDLVRIENNTIEGANEGILVTDASRALIANNTVRNANTGFVMYGGYVGVSGGDVRIVDNAACHVEHGFLPHAFYKGEIQRNLIEGSDVAIDVRNDWTIHNNVIRNSRIALDVAATHDYLVSMNDIVEFTTSIWARSNATLENNWWGQPDGPDPATIIASGVVVDILPASPEPHLPLLPTTTCSTEDAGGLRRLDNSRPTLHYGGAGEF